MQSILFMVLGVGAIVIGRDPNGLANKIFGFPRWIQGTAVPVPGRALPGDGAEGRASYDSDERRRRRVDRRCRRRRCRPRRRWTRMPLLHVDDVVVQFGGVTAVNHANFEVEAGTITGLIGPNGAGKTTCFNVITGLQTPTVGSSPPRRQGHHPDAGAPPLQARDRPHLPAAGGLRLADRRGQRPDRPGHPRRLRAACSARRPTTDVDRPARAGRHLSSTPTTVPTRSRPVSPGCSSWPARWPATRGCCCSTSRPRVWTRPRPTPSATCSRSSPPRAARS